MEAVAAQVKQLAGVASEAARKDIIIALRDLAASLESTDDTMDRIMYLHLQVAGVRTGIGLKLFDMLAASGIPLNLQHLARETGASSIFLGRLLRYLSSIGMTKEAGKDTFTATNVTKALASPGNQAGVIHCFDTVGPMFQEMPAFLAKTNYQDPKDSANTVFQAAWKTELPVFLWYPQQEETYAQFNKHMAARRESMISWLSVYPIEHETKGWNPEAPVFVDIGGGIGHQCAELREKYPKLPGKVILQELPHAIEQALPTPGVENTTHDFFTPQPVQGAKYYHMRGVLHDFPDDTCRLILQNIIPAMSKESAILIDDMVLPDVNVHWQATQIDLTMMCALAGMERTREQWLALLDSVGLRIAQIYVHIPSDHESVIVAVSK